MSNALQGDTESLLDQAIFEESGKSKCLRKMENIFCSVFLNFVIVSLVTVYLVVTMQDLSKRVDSFDTRIQTVESQMLVFQSQITDARKSIEKDKQLVEHDTMIVEEDKKQIESLVSSLDVQLLDLQRNVSYLLTEFYFLHQSVSSHTDQISAVNQSILANEEAVSETEHLANSNHDHLEEDVKLMKANLEAIAENRKNITMNTKLIARDENTIVENTVKTTSNLRSISQLLANTSSNTRRIETNSEGVQAINKSMKALNTSLEAYIQSEASKEKLNGCYFNYSQPKERFYVQNQIFMRQPSNDTGYVMVAYVQKWTSATQFQLDFIFGPHIGLCEAVVQNDPNDHLRYTITLRQCGSNIPRHLFPCDSKSSFKMFS